MGVTDFTSEVTKSEVSKVFNDEQIRSFYEIMIENSSSERNALTFTDRAKYNYKAMKTANFLQVEQFLLIQICF